jgi:hypothetical protein
LSADLAFSLIAEGLLAAFSNRSPREPTAVFLLSDIRSTHNAGHHHGLRKTSVIAAE